MKLATLLKSQTANLFIVDSDSASIGQSSLSELSKRLLQFRQDFKQVGDETVVGDLEDRGLLILVDGDDDLRILHAGEVLDAAGNVEIGRHDLAGLADLPVVRGVTGIDGSEWLL